MEFNIINDNTEFIANKKEIDSIISNLNTPFISKENNKENFDEYINDNLRKNTKIKKEAYSIRELDEEQMEEAFNLSFNEFIEYTTFSKFKSNYKEAKNIHLAMAKQYHKEHKTKVLGSFCNNELVGMLEINNNYINQIAVKNDMKNYGIGKSLFLESIKDKEEDTEIYLDADKNAIEIYKKWGFSPCEDEYAEYCKMIYIVTKEKSYNNIKIITKKS